jgi:hypothetical protein
MNDAMTISAAGLRGYAGRFETDAREIVKATNPVSATGAGLETAVVAQITDANAFKTNAAVFKTAEKMSGTLLDLTA